ncbi:MAG: hypothetical protein LBE18_09750 [Planctomycetaceae bacterium]|jgi:hypothetical protein|nr:hypothetical protein [Planctomycetaceae bacterium]
MKVIKFLFFLFCIVGYFFECTIVSAQSPLLEDIVAGYKTNASFFYSSRVYYEFYEEEKRSFYGDKDRNKDLIKNIPEVKSQKFAYDYWTDFNNILLRGGNANDIDLKELFANQKTDLKSSDFETLYRRTPVFSYVAKNKLAYQWIGYSSAVSVNNTRESEHAFAQIEIDRVPNSIKNFHYPPFLTYSFDEAEFNAEEVFPADYFFAGSLKDKSILGKINIKGKDYVVMESRKLNPNIIDGTSSGFVFYNVYTGWIDTEQGFLPVRIQAAHAQSVNGKFVDGYTSSLQYSEKASPVFEIHNIKKIGDAFYPMETSLCFTGFSVQAPEPKPISEIDNNNSDKKVKEQDKKNIDNSPQSAYLFNNVQKWVIHRVQPDVVFPNDTLTLPFPKGTEVFDTRTKKISIAGITEKEYEAQIKSELTKYDRDSGYVLPNPNAKRKIEDYIQRSSGNYRITFFIIGFNLIVWSLFLWYFLIRWKNYRNRNSKSKK